MVKLSVSAYMISESKVFPFIHSIEHTEEVDVELHYFLISALDGGEWSALHLLPFILEGKSIQYPNP